MQERVIITKPQERCGVYAILNLVQKKVYVGESMDLYQRLSDHIRNIMFGLENNGTNNNLVRDAKENGRTFEAFPVLFAPNYDKNKKDAQRKHDWIIDETIYMYLFRKYGFELYNGEDGRDNVGGERKFLIDNTIVGEDLDRELEGFLNKEKLPYSICQVEEELDKDLLKRFGKTLCELSTMTDEERQKVWNERAKAMTVATMELKEDGILYALDPLSKKGYVASVCNELLKERLKKEDMERCGVEGMDLRELVSLAENGELDRIALCQFGHYLDQSPVTILTTKCYDIKRNKMITGQDGFKIVSDAEEGKGICFWAFKRKPQDAEKYLSEDNKGPKYVIMPYTTSASYKDGEKDINLKKKAKADLNPYDGESMEQFFQRMWESYKTKEKKVKKLFEKFEEWDKKAEDAYGDDYQECLNNKGKALIERMNLPDIFALGYSFGRREKDRVSYPEGMFPEVVAKWSVNETTRDIRNSANLAFLISELKYIDAKMNEEDIFPFYLSQTNNPIEKTMKGINSKCCAKLLEKDMFIRKCKGLEAETLNNKDEVRFLIAKIEYPYIVELANNPVD